MFFHMAAVVYESHGPLTIDYTNLRKVTVVCGCVSCGITLRSNCDIIVRRTWSEY